jgi:hypothetical protein
MSHVEEVNTYKRGFVSFNSNECSDIYRVVKASDQPTRLSIYHVYPIRLLSIH